MPQEQKIPPLTKFFLFLSVFLCGGCTMILEIVGSRILAPFFGTSLYTWASLIGVVLGCMSLGYYLGGKLADKKASLQIYSLLLAAAAFFILLLVLTKTIILTTIFSWQLPYPYGALFASVVLFGLPSAALATVPPYSIKLLLENFASAGSTAGLLYALGTVGSIIGTFLAGFVLIPFFGVTNILLGLTGILFLLCLLLSYKTNLFCKSALLVLLLLALFHSARFDYSYYGLIYQGETEYGSVMIFDIGNTRTMYVNGGAESQKFLDGEELAFAYTRYFDLAFHFNQAVQNSLCLGGAGYSYPQYYLANYPGKKIDVVEIDPAVTKLAREYFGLGPAPALKIFHQDARSFLNTNSQKYDAVFGDAYHSTTPPYELLTLEANQSIYRQLNEGGVFVLNLIASFSGENSQLFYATYNTLQKVFSQLYVFQVEPAGEEELQNIAIVALKSERQPSLSSQNPEHQTLLETRVAVQSSPVNILTDNYTPVEYYTRNYH